MWEELRRIITGVDTEGQSTVIIDDHLPRRLMFDDMAGLHEVWTDPGDPLDRLAGHDQADRAIRLAPEAGEVRFRFFTLAPAPAPNTITQQQMEHAYRQAFAAMGGESHRRDTRRHPGMHETASIDCIVLLQGRVKLILDNDMRELKPLDIVIQRGTNHAWEVIGDEPALLLAVLVQRELI